MHSELAFLAIGTTQFILIVITLLLLFGGTKIPELMRGLGNGIKEFKSAVKDEHPKEKTEGKSSSKES